MIHTAFGYDGSVRIKADLNHSNFDKGLSSMKGQVDKFSVTLKKLASTVAFAFGTAALIRFGKESVNLASDIQEVQNVIDVTFGKGAAQIEEFAQSAAEAYGMSELAAKQYTGTMGAMLKSSGLATGAAQEMSMALTGLAGDIASFYNLDTDMAFEKIRSGISGETEPLKQLGINMSVANLEAYALSKGITKSYNAMSQAEQVLLRYNYLLSVTTDAQGDFARTSGSFANQIRILQLNFEQLKIAVGNAIIPIAQAVLPGINAIIAALTKLAKVFAQVTALLFGKAPAVGSGQAKEQEKIASSGIAAADATDKLSDATAGAGEASKKAAKDMKGVLAGFDELNILADSAASSVDGAAGGIGDIGAGDVDIPDLGDMDGGAILEIGENFKSLGEIFRDTLDEMLAGIPRLREAFLNFADSFNDFNQKLYDAFKFDGVLERVEMLGRELAKAFNDLVNAIDWELWGRTLGAGLNLGLQFLTEFIYTFDWINLGKKLAEFINGLVYEVDWYDFGRLLWAQFKLGLETFAGFITGLDMPALAQAASNIIMGFFNSMQETIAKIDWAVIGRQIAEFLNSIDWLGIITSIAGAIGEMIPSALELIGGFIQNADTGTLIAAALFFGSKLLPLLLGKVIEPIAKQIGSDLIKQISAAITSGGIGELVSSISSAIAGIGKAFAGISAVIAGVVLAATSFFDMWNNGFSLAKEAVMLVGIALAAVGAVLLGVPAAVAAIVAGIVAAVATAAVVIHEHWDEIKEAALNAWESIKEAWNAAGEWFSENVITPVVEFFSGLWENVSALASEAWQSVQEVWSAVSGWFSENVVQPLAEGWDTFWTDLGQWASDTWGNIQDTWASVSGWFDENVTKPVGEFFDSLWKDLKQWAKDTWEDNKETWKNAPTWFTDNVLDPLGKFFGDLWDDIKEDGGDTWEKIKDVWGEAKSWFEEHVTTPLGDAWNAVVDTIKNAINSIIGKVEGLINSVIKGVNWLIDQLNKIRFDVPDWVPGIGGKNFGFNISHVQEVKLPRLANGAVIPPNQQFAAILGDQRSGKNIEAPLSTIEQALQNVMNRNVNAGYVGDITVILQLNETELGRTVYRLNNKETQRVGVRLAGVKA